MEMISSIQELSEITKTEQYSKNKNERYRLLIETSPYAIGIIQEGKIIYTNKAALQLFNAKTYDDILGKSISSFIHPDGLAVTKKRIARLLAGEEVSYPVEDKYIKLDGSVFPVEVSAVSLLYNGKPAIQLIALDITDKKKEEMELATGAIRRQFLIEKSRDGILIMDTKGRVVETNLRAAEMLGYSQEEFLLLTVFDWDLESTKEKLQRVLDGANEKGEIFETIHTRKDGSKLDVEVSANGTYFMGQKLIFCVVRDITERKKAEKELADELLRRRLLIEYSRDGIVVIDKNGKVRESNLRFSEMLGYKPQEIMKLHVWDWEFLFSQEELLKKLHDVDETGEHFETQHKRKDGSVYGVEISSNGAIFGEEKLVFCVCRDITKRKKAQAELEETLNNLRKSIETTIDALARAIEMRDPYTAGHQKRVADLAGAIGMEMDLPTNQIKGLQMAASIHDIGKISIPSEILTKSSRLTDLEYSIIKEHPRYGMEILRDVFSPWPLAEIVYQHHEKINGSGYPQGLKGDQILLEARILCVADVVEAMASHRPYRPSIGLKTALREIEDQKGILYDAQVVDICMKLFNENKFSF